MRAQKESNAKDRMPVTVFGYMLLRRETENNYKYNTIIYSITYIKLYVKKKEIMIVVTKQKKNKNERWPFKTQIYLINNDITPLPCPLNHFHVLPHFNSMHEVVIFLQHRTRVTMPGSERSQPYPLMRKVSHLSKCKLVPPKIKEGNLLSEYIMPNSSASKLWVLMLILI